MSQRYDRDYDRGAQDYRRRNEQDYGGSYGERSESMYGYAGEPEAEKYTRHLGSDRSRFSMGSSDEYRRNRGEYGGGREGYWGGGWENEHDERSRYGNPVGGSGFERGYNQSRTGYSQRSNYPSGYRSGERYGAKRPISIRGNTISPVPCATSKKLFPALASVRIRLSKALPPRRVTDGLRNGYFC